jgi:hypothetical protein
MERELVEWKCKEKKGHVLGQMRRNGRGRMVLLLYRDAVDPRHPGKRPPEVLGVLYGSMIGVTCSVCGKRRTWGQETTDETES